MKVGRKAKPALDKIARGNPGKGPINDDQPMPDPGIPPAPVFLSDEAKEEWDWISERLFDAGILAEIDKGQLAVYCQAYARWAEAERELAQCPMIYITPKGDYKSHPAVYVANANMRILQSAIATLGMNPSSRNGIKALDAGAKKGKGDPWADYQDRIRKAQKKRRKDKLRKEIEEDKELEAKGSSNVSEMVLDEAQETDDQ